MTKSLKVKKTSQHARSRVRVLILISRLAAVPASRDVVLMSYVWSAIGEEDITVLARRAAAALPPAVYLVTDPFFICDVSHSWQRLYKGGRS